MYDIVGYCDFVEVEWVFGVVYMFVYYDKIGFWLVDDCVCGWC